MRGYVCSNSTYTDFLRENQRFFNELPSAPSIIDSPPQFRLDLRKLDVDSLKSLDVFATPLQEHAPENVALIRYTLISVCRSLGVGHSQTLCGGRMLHDILRV